MNTGKLIGKVAIVTGASSGIGEATAIALAKEGAKVAIAARRTDRLEALAQKIKTMGGEVLAATIDATDEAQIHQLIDKIQTTWGRIDILINNAGVMLLGNINGANTEDWRRMFDLNVLGLMYGTHAVLPVMKSQNGGQIVNVSSVAGRVARAGLGVYNATKFAVNAFSEALRQEVYKDNIRITLIEPGLVATELPNHITDPDAKVWAQEVYDSVRRLDSEDVAAAILYAVSQPTHVNVNEILIRPTEQAA
jgi:NADP-dependent 3-hydroxy acid dehydrogenase YdfG